MLSLGNLAAKIFGSSNERRVKAFRPKVEAINKLEAELVGLSDDELRARTDEFRSQLASGKKLDDLLIPAFATVREAAKRTLGQRHFDVQLIGGMVLHQGDISEMKTGEGKTLVATLPVYLNALSGQGVHVVTVNDYLAKRDSEWMGQIYRFLGLTVGVIVHDLTDEQRKVAYACDVTYGTNNELGFDYLRDNMKMRREEMVQFGFRDFGAAMYVTAEDRNPGARIGKALGLLQEVATSLPSYARAGDAPGLKAYWQKRVDEAEAAIEAAAKLLIKAKEDFASKSADDDAETARRERLNEQLAEALAPLRWVVGDVAAMSEGKGAGHAFAIVDEVDSILIDEARTPLIISGPLEDRADLYQAIDEEMVKLVKVGDEIERNLKKKLEGEALKEALKTEGLFELDEKQRQVSLTEAGNVYMEDVLAKRGLVAEGGSLYDIENVTVVHHINQALKAHKLFQRDKDYIIKGGEVVIIDEFTGRMMPGRRYSEGLHQALEAKEHVEIKPENQTLASITFQNYFRLYDKLAGMTGTANTEANEFMDIYGLEVIEIPTNVGVARIDEDDEIYRTAREKLDAIITTIADCTRRGQPILVGTTSIEKSEQLSELLKDRKYIAELAKKTLALADKLKAPKEGKKTQEGELKEFLTDIGGYLARIAADKKAGDPIPHQVLNARFHEQEANIIAQAGVPGAVTIATNMAGRGTDIQLGGNAEARLRDWLAEVSQVEGAPAPDDKAIDKKRAEIKADIEVKKKQALDAGGLCVVGTERHESRRIDNQLRGRSGRQGDPGRSKFYLSLEDDLMRIFGSDRMDAVLKTLGLQEGEAITHPWMNKSLEMAQKKVEARNFDIRKQILKYDDVMNDQRKVIFEQRIDIMGEDDVAETVNDLRHQVVREMVHRFIPEKAYAEQWDTAGLKEAVKTTFGIELPVEAWADEEGIADEEIRERIQKAVDDKAREIQEEVGTELLKQYRNEKEFLSSIASDETLSGLVKSPEGKLADIGRYLFSDANSAVKVGGFTPEQAAVQAWQIGGEFLNRYEQARGFTAEIDALPEPSPHAVGGLRLREIEKMVLLQALDHLWREHLVTLEHLRQVIGFRAYGQRDPLNEYKSEAFVLFEAMLAKLRENVTGVLMSLRANEPEQQQAVMQPVELPPMEAHHADPNTGLDEFELAEADAAMARGAQAARAAQQPPKQAPLQTRKSEGGAGVDAKDPATWGRVSRNAPCPCGSGKKYKHCHGKHG